MFFKIVLFDMTKQWQATNNTERLCSYCSLFLLLF